MTTRQYAIDNAARVLRNYEKWHIKNYGGSGSKGLELAAAWTALAAVIDTPESTHSRSEEER